MTHPKRKGSGTLVLLIGLSDTARKHKLAAMQTHLIKEKGDINNQQSTFPKILKKVNLKSFFEYPVSNISKTSDFI